MVGPTTQLVLRGFLGVAVLAEGMPDGNDDDDVVVVAVRVLVLVWVLVVVRSGQVELLLLAPAVLLLLFRLECEEWDAATKEA